MQSRPSGAGSERGDGRSLSPRRPAPSRRKRGALGWVGGRGRRGRGGGWGQHNPSGLGFGCPASWPESCVGSIGQRVPIVVKRT